MKKTLYYTLSLLFAGLFLGACAKESIEASFGQEGEVKLTLRLASDDLQSRAEAGEDNYNENAIKKVDLYLYPSGGAGNALHKVSQTFDNTKAEAELTTTLSNDLVESLFGNGTACHAYALVNYMGTAPEANTTASSIASLKAMEISSTFNNEGGIQESFVMDGESTAITYNAGTLAVTGEVKVDRAASKISLFVTGVDKTVTDDAGNTWEPDYTNMDISFHNGVNKAKVDVGYTDGRPNNPLASVAANYYATSGNRDITAEMTNETSDAYTLSTTHIPFYSYSSDWGRATNPDTEPTITLMVPWRKVKDASNNVIPEDERIWQTCYYQIPVNVESTNSDDLKDCMERNTYYKIKLHVGILGDFNPATPTELTASYYTVEWKTEDVDVDIKNYKYLVVDKNDVTVYNENEVRIGYASSDAIKAEITYIRRPDYSDEEVDTTRFYGTLTSTSGLSTVAQGTNSLLRQCAVTIENNEIVLKHDIVNKSTETGKNYDYVPYYIWIKITMTVKVNGVDKTFTEWIRYEQYPAMYIKANLNSDYNNDNSINGNKGFVWVNGYQGEPSTTNNNFPTRYVRGNNQQFLGTADGLASTSNANPNMYVITTSLFSDDEYVIGDPRTNYYQDLFTNNYAENNTSISKNTEDLKFGNSQRYVWISAKALHEDQTRRLKYYYPTDDSDRTINMVAPKIRVASSYSVVDGKFLYYKESARRRCASYQEDGYPAGRWRLPTLAEGEYIVKLSAEGKIPTLFSNNGSYWCAHGYFIPNNSTGNVTYYDDDYDTGSSVGYSVRCVYDEWYWGSEQLTNKTVFTWGDAPRN